jgi:hypothetical protein
MIMRLLLMAAFLGATLSAANACDPTTMESGILFCKSQCDLTHKNDQCDGSGQMAAQSRLNDPNGVQRGFNKCHPGEKSERDNVQDCHDHNPFEVVNRACKVYGGCPCELTRSCPPPVNPPPKPINLDFNQPMAPASDSKNIVIADFTLPGKGAYRSITINFTKDGVNVFNLSTYAVNFDNEGDKVHVKITTYDKSVDDVKRHKYSVAGTLELTP